MKERGILFSAPMVQAILRDVDPKTQTRRVVTMNNSHFGSAPDLYFEHGDFNRAWVDGNSRSLQYLHVPCHVEIEGDCKVCDERGWPGTSHRLYPDVWPKDSCTGQEDECPPYRLWVREAWAYRLDHDHLNGTQLYEAGVRQAWYWADGPGRCCNTGCAGAAGRVRAARFMPRWASRITMDVEAVRVQRVQDITNEDAFAEGCDFRVSKTPNHAAAFAILWDAINLARGFGWYSNPWVWAYTFRRIQQGER